MSLCVSGLGRRGKRLQDDSACDFPQAERRQSSVGHVQGNVAPRDLYSMSQDWEQSLRALLELVQEARFASEEARSRYTRNQARALGFLRESLQ